MAGTAQDPPPGSAPLPRPRLSGWVILICVVELVALVATSTRYGYHGDELYFVVAGEHPAFGYPDQPPLVPLICAAMQHLVPMSLLLLHMPSAIATVLTTLVGATVSRDLGGSGRAQLISALACATSGFILAIGHLVSTTSFDLLSTSVAAWLLVRAVVRHSGRDLLLAGVAVGAGFEAKPNVAVVAVLVIVSFALVGPRWTLRSPWLAGGVVAAGVLALPYLLWQQAHGWPQLTVAGQVAGSAEGGRIGFIPFQFLLVSPVLCPIWIAGLIVPFRRAALASVRFVPVVYVLLAVTYLVADGKAYYQASLYPVVLGIGALPTADWCTRGRSALRVRLLAVAVAVSALVSGVTGLPFLPARTLTPANPVMAINPDLGATIGWPAYIETVTRQWDAIPSQERAHAVIFTSSYAEAGAIDILGRSHGLPRAYSGHNGFSEWGIPPDDASPVLVIGYDQDASLRRYFSGCRRVATIDNGLGVQTGEQGAPVLRCRPAQPWTGMWPELTHYD